MSTQAPDTPALLHRLDRHLTNPQRRALVAWAGELLQIREARMPPLRKAKLALDATYRAEVVVPILDGAANTIVDVAWRDRAWAARLGLGAAAVAALAYGGQGAGIAALGGAVGVPLWIVLGGGGAFAGMLVDELQRSIARHGGGRGAAGVHPEIDDAEWELLPRAEARLPVGREEGAAHSREPLWRVFRRAYRDARARQVEHGPRTPPTAP